MKRIVLAGVSAFALSIAAAAVGQTPPAPTPQPSDKAADPVNPQKAEQEPRPAEQEAQRLRALQKDAPQPGAATGPTPPATDLKPGEKAKWDVSNPPGPAKDATIDVTTGTWMSVDVSPDGREVVFDLLGDLYVMPIAGGEARALTTGVAWDMQPKFSPNGRWIAFTSDRGGGDNIWIVDRNGSNPRQVTKETFRLLNSPSWSPDSEYIVARKHFTGTRSLGAGEMWLYHRSGGEGVQLTKRRTQQKDSGEPAFSPDGRYLYFSDDTTPGEIFEYSKDPNTQIYAIQRLDRRTGEVSPYVTGPGGSIRPTPSPDGKSLAFVRRVRYKSTLFVRDLESGRETPVYDGLDRDMQETWAVHGVYPAMAWTPDNKSIVVWAGGKIRRVDVAAKSVSDIPFHVRATRRMQDAVRTTVDVAPDRFEVKMLRWAQVSPRGDKVVYQALGRLWVKDLNGNAAPRRLTRQGDHFEHYPAWSRDGRSIVYTTWDDQDLGSIRVVSTNGGEGRVISRKPGHYLEPQFSPDGSKIVYRIAADGFLLSPLYRGEEGIYVTPAAGGEPQLVTKSGAQPRFASANDRIYFMSFEKEGKRGLRSVELDGSDERTHLISSFAGEYALSPDEKWVAWTERFNAYVMPFVATGQTVDISPETKALPVTRVTRDAGEWLHWSGDSSRIWWSLGPEVFSRDVKDAFAFVEGAPAELPKAPERGMNVSFTAEYARPEGRVALVGGRVVTMRGDEVIEDGVVLLNGNRIEAVGPRGQVTVPAGARTIDVAGKTVLPGFIDAHWHGSMGANEIIPEQSWVNLASLAFGVTTIHDPSNDTSEIFAHSEMARAGQVLAPRIFSTGTILYGATTPYTAKIDSLEDALSTLRRMKAVGAFSVKSYNQPRRDQRQQIIEAARQLNMAVVPEGGSLFMGNMTMLIDGHTTVEHSLPVAKFYDDVRQLWDQSGTHYTPTLVVAYGGAFGENYWYQTTDVWNDPRLTNFVPRRILDARGRRPVHMPKEEFNFLDIAKGAKQIGDTGALVSIGAHGQREGLGAHWDLWMMQMGGMSNMEALRTATINPARVLGMDKDLGSIEAGKLADILVLDANPLENIRNSTSIRYTIANGRVFDAMTMNEVGKASRGPLWFQQAGGEVWTAATAAAATDSHGH
jgi:imidazolonepropionase-like amidohydrolase/Tol biopolymer transport system component